MKPAEMVTVSWRPAAELHAALALLTRVPGPRSVPTTGGASAFGLVGALVGLVGGTAILLVGDAAPLAAAGLAIAAMALVTGGLHLDGVADTADALAAIGPEAAERARLDPRIGAAGAVGIAAVFVLDAGWLVALVERTGPSTAALACITAAAVSRALVVGLVGSRPSRQRGGSAGWFMRVTGPWSALAAAGSAALVVGLAAVTAADVALVTGALAGAFVAFVAASWLIRARDGIDGDLLGASIEITFASVLGATLLLSP